MKEKCNHWSDIGGVCVWCGHHDPAKSKLGPRATEAWRKVREGPATCPTTPEG